MRLLHKFLASVLLTACSTSSAQIDKIISFGDSLSDTGNIAEWLGYIMPAKPYYKYRFSNGPVWVEHLSHLMQLPMENHSYGGAESSNYLIGDSGLAFKIRAKLTGNMLAEVEKYAQPHVPCAHFHDAQCQPKFDHLFVLWIGANNYLNKVTMPSVMREMIETPTNIDYVNHTVADIQKSLKLLYDNGARHFLVPNLPRLGITPFAKKSGFVKSLDELADNHNKYLAMMLNQFAKDHTDAVMVFLDTNAQFLKLQASPKKYGYSNYTDSCYAGGYTGSSNAKEVCSNPLEYLFWDTVHPTGKTHCHLAFMAHEFLVMASLSKSSHLQEFTECQKLY
jgi:outer membrane lipase/esterase